MTEYLLCKAQHELLIWNNLSYYLTDLKLITLHMPLRYYYRESEILQ